jgi:hypothetical protein
MVMSLQRPATCSVEIIDEIVAQRQNGVNAAFFNGIQNEWRTRVQEYIAQLGSPEFVHEWPAISPRKGTFLNLYLSPRMGSAQGEMMALLRDNDLTLCPICGEAGRPNTLDHYLPKARYPHFCVTPLNLFPMCDACQLAKGNKTGNTDSPRFFIHPYFDVFVAHRVLELTIESPYDEPTFALSSRSGLSAEHTELLTSHLRELRIVARYAHFFRGQHRRLLKLVSAMRESDQNIQVNLAAFRDSCSTPSRNSWEYVFYCAVLADGDLLQYLENAQLPEYS